MPIEWPTMLEDSCQHFRVFALFGGIDPRTLTVTQTPASELKSRTTSPGAEAETYARIQPVFHLDNKLALILEMSRKGYFDGKEPEDLSTLTELLRRTDTFLGDECQIQVTGEYFLGEFEAPEALAVAFGPFGTSPRFRTVTGIMQVEGSAVQQIQWIHREDHQWKITLTGWLKGKLTADVMRDTQAKFHGTFRSLREAKAHGIVL